MELGDRRFARMSKRSATKAATSVIPFKMTTITPLPWGSGGRDKSKNPMNNHILSTASFRSPK
jgi:hypothetical protein